MAPYFVAVLHPRIGVYYVACNVYYALSPADHKWVDDHNSIKLRYGLKNSGEQARASRRKSGATCVVQRLAVATRGLICRGISAHYRCEIVDVDERVVFSMRSRKPNREKAGRS